MAKTYAHTLASIKAVKTRIDQLQAKLAKECSLHDELSKELQEQLAAQLGQPVLVGERAMSRKSEVVLEQIGTYRRQNLSFEEIARKLNISGFRTEVNSMFTGVLVREIFEGMD